MQFAVTSSEGSVKAEKELRIQVQNLQSETDEKSAEIHRLSLLSLSQGEKVQELEEQIRWMKVDFDNQLSSKEAKIQHLTRNLSVQSVQNRCKQLYEDGQEDVEDKMDEVVRRAKIPSRSTVTKDNNINNNNNNNSSKLPEDAAFLLRSLPDAASTRTKVFRHKLQKSMSRNAPVDTSVVVAASAVALPRDYRASVATLPPISVRPDSSVSSFGGNPHHSLRGRRSSSSVEVAVSALPASQSSSAGSNGEANLGGHQRESFA